MNAKLVFYPNPILRKITQAIAQQEFGSIELINLIKSMFEIIYSHNGIGLAGPQIGIDKQILIMDLYDEDGKRGDFVAFDEESKLSIQNQKIVMINPEIIYKSKEMHAQKEGCLSLPEINVWVNRPKQIKVRFFDEYGKQYYYLFDSLLARCAQHEIDHLNGKLIIDYKNYLLNSKSDQQKIQNKLIKLEKKYFG